MSTNSNAKRKAGTDGFSEAERAAIKERAAELKKEANRGPRDKAAAAALDVLSKIAEMEPPDRALAERIHAIVTTNAPELSPKLWYGQPAYARKGKVVCFFRSGHVDKEPYSTFSFTAARRRASGSPVSAYTHQGCRLPPDGARRAASRISRTSDPGTGVPR